MKTEQPMSKVGSDHVKSGSLIFISYRTVDEEVTRDFIHDKLVKAFGKEAVFLADDSIQAGQAIPEQITDALSKTSVMVVLIGSQWLGAQADGGKRKIDDPEDWVQFEIREALNNKLEIIPVLLGSTLMPPRHSLPKTIESSRTKKRSGFGLFVIGSQM